MSQKPDYQSIALKIILPNNHRGITQLRTLSAAALESEVRAALIRHTEESFPDLAATRKELSNRRCQLDDEAEEMKRKHQERDTALNRREQDVEKQRAEQVLLRFGSRLLDQRERNKGADG